jgi:hypothetical protein
MPQPRTIDDLKRPGLEEAAGRRIADDDREPVAGVDDQVECKRDQQQPGQELDAAADLLEHFLRERCRDSMSVLRLRGRTQDGHLLCCGGRPPDQVGASLLHRSQATGVNTSRPL